LNFELHVYLYHALIEIAFRSTFMDFKEKGDASLIAVIDDGIDIFHQTFLDINGKTRIIAIWDQNKLSSDNKPEGFPYGREYTETDINIAIRDRSSTMNESIRRHGTQVASIAAGRKINNFSGMAPDAKIIVVIPKRGEPGFKNEYVLALKYIERLAEKYNKPVVVNISQGYNLGAHDGSSLIEEKCDEFSDSGRKPGFVIVTSAGNERDKKGHAVLMPPENGGTEFIEWISEDFERTKDLIEIRFNHSNLMKFRLINPSGQHCDWIDPVENQNASYTFPNSNNLGQLSYVKCDPRNGRDSIVSITISPSLENNKIEVGKWQLEIESIEILNSQDIIHAWIQYIPNRSRKRIRFNNHISEITTLTIPANAKSVISVGAADSMHSFNVTDYSSFGPTRDNEREEIENQPVFIASGNNVSSAISAKDYSPNPHSSLERSSGTSLSAAYITGVIALLLSKNKKEVELDNNIQLLNAIEIKRMLISNINVDEWSNEVGYGALNYCVLMHIFGCVRSIQFV
jgi:subtilisin family serine protease